MFSRVQTLNYRSIRYVDYPLSPFQVLIGPNGSGKSSFLDVVTFLGDYVRDGLDHALLQSIQNTTRQATQVEKLILNPSRPGFELAIELKVPEQLSSSYQYARYEVGVKKKDTGELAIAGENFWLQNKPPGQVVPEQVKVPKSIITVTGKGKKKPPSKRQWRKVMGKIVKSGNDYYRDEFLNWSMPFRVGPRTSTLGALPQNEERFPIAVWVRDLLREGIQTLTLNSTAMKQPCSPTFPRTFQVDGSNLPLVVQDLQKNTQVFQEWVKHIQTVLPDLDTILVEERPEDKHLYLAIKYHGRPATVPSWQLNHETLSMLALTLLAYMDMPRGEIYLIQEPENDIHPKGIEAVFLALTSVEDRQIFLRTRSSLFLDLAKREQGL